MQEEHNFAFEVLMEALADAVREHLIEEAKRKAADCLTTGSMH